MAQFHIVCLRLVLVGWFVAGPLDAAVFSKRKLKLKRGLQVDNCSGSPKEDPVKIRDLDLFTNKDGDLDISGKVLLTKELNSSVKAVVSLQRRMLGYVWVPVPCLSGVGSCVFEDLCTFGLSEDEDCPPVFDEHQVPCRCPVQPGAYELLEGQFIARTPKTFGLMAGTYHAKVVLTENETHLACYNTTFKLE